MADYRPDTKMGDENTDATDYVGPCDSELLSEYIVQEERADTGLNMEVQVKQENHVQEGNSLIWHHIYRM